MQVIRPVGRGAQARKYDILSALAAHALAGDKHRQRLILRLMALITTRYNWQRDELTMGQREIARLWSVDERTVKRDMARLRELGWIDVRQPGARGRVSVIGICVERILLDTQGEWARIGPDFVARLGGEYAGDPVATDSTVVPFRRPDGAGTTQSDPGAGIGAGGAGGADRDPALASAPRDMPAAGAGGDAGLWARVAAHLATEDRAIFDAWFAALRPAGRDGAALRMICPSRFHATYLRTHLSERLTTALRRADGSVTAVRLETAG